MQGSYIKKKEKHSRDAQTLKLLFGLGAVPHQGNKTVSLLPSGFGGLIKAEIVAKENEARIK